MLINLFKFIQLLSGRTGVWAQECVSRGSALPSEDKDTEKKKAWNNWLVLTAVKNFNQGIQ